MRLPFLWFNVSQPIDLQCNQSDHMKGWDSGNHNDKKGQTIYFYLIRVLILSDIYLEDLFRKVGCCCCYGHQREGDNWCSHQVKMGGTSYEGSAEEVSWLKVGVPTLQRQGIWVPLPSNVPWGNGYTLFPISNSKAKDSKTSSYIFKMSQTFKWF